MIEQKTFTPICVKTTQVLLKFGYTKCVKLIKKELKMILNQAQAEAVCSAMAALNNVGAVSSDIDADDFDLRIRHGVITIRSHSGRETYADQAAFAAAYGLN